MPGKICPFCSNDRQLLFENGSCSALLDTFPVSQGHTLITTHRHTDSFFDLTEAERRDMFELLDRVKSHLDTKYNPSAYNIGLNDGPAAGQTIPHVHLHVIPRYDGDVSDPRGGIRWILPDKARYWEDGE